MRFFSIYIWLCVSALFLAVGGCTSGSINHIPEDWRNFDIDGKFSFCAPDDFEEQPGRGIDSLVIRYTNQTISLIGDYGWYNSDYTRRSGQWSKIGGEDAYLISSATLPDTEQQSAIAYFPHIEEPDENGMRKTLQVIVRFNGKEAAKADMIIRSIRFAETSDW